MPRAPLEIMEPWRMPPLGVGGWLVERGRVCGAGAVEAVWRGRHGDAQRDWRGCRVAPADGRALQISGASNARYQLTVEALVADGANGARARYAPGNSQSRNPSPLAAHAARQRGRRPSDAHLHGIMGASSMRFRSLHGFEKPGQASNDRQR